MKKINTAFASAIALSLLSGSAVLADKHEGEKKADTAHGDKTQEHDKDKDAKKPEADKAACAGKGACGGMKK